MERSRTLPIKQAIRDQRDMLLRSIGPGVTVGVFRFVPLVDGDSISQEGDAMQNCLPGCSSLYLDGEYVLFSLRESYSGRRLACFSARLAVDSWVLDEIAGPRNEAVAPEAVDAARAFIGVWNDAARMEGSLG